MLKKRTVFLRWWLFTCLILLGSFGAFYYGFFQNVWEQDFTKLSFLVTGLLVYFTAKAGSISWKLSSLSILPHAYGQAAHSSEWRLKELKKLNNDAEKGWFVSDLVMTVGMVGTVIGFMTMLVGLGDVDVSNVSTVQDLIKKLGYGMSTALYTTLFGLVCGSLLKVQYFNIDCEIKDLKL